MQLKYFGFKWSRKTHSRWVVKSGRVQCVCTCEEWRCVCVCVYRLFGVRLYLSITCDCNDSGRLGSRRFQILFQMIYLSRRDYFLDYMNPNKLFFRSWKYFRRNEITDKAIKKRLQPQMNHSWARKSWEKVQKPHHKKLKLHILISPHPTTQHVFMEVSAFGRSAKENLNGI